ncbi:MAG: hypothetical protein ABEH64_10145 [Salinirussus sp.]
MASELGVGVRVWIAWTPTEKLESMENGDPRLRLGTVTAGPFNPGIYILSDGPINLQMTAWNVDIDGWGETFADEQLLFPVDDGEPESVTESEPSTAEA